MSGVKVIGTLPFFAVILSDSLSVLPWPPPDPYGIVSKNEATIAHPPSGDSDANPDEYWLLLCTLYDLQWSPCHWYNRINVVLLLIGLKSSLEDPCLYTGFFQDLSDTFMSPSTMPLSFGLYVNNCV
jgi:hypothetical protein